MNLLDTIKPRKITSINIPNAKTSLYRRLHMEHTYHRAVEYYTDEDLEKGTIYLANTYKPDQFNWYEMLDRIEYIPRPFMQLDIQITRYFDEDHQWFSKYDEELFKATFNEKTEKKHCYRIYINFKGEVTFKMYDNTVPLPVFVTNTVLSYILFNSCSSEIEYVN